MDPSLIKQIDLEMIELELSRRKLLNFTKNTFRKYQEGEHQVIIADELDKFINRDTKNLIIQAPPRHGKSELASRRLPAYILGKNPDAQIISCSYSADLSSRMNRDVQRVIDTPEYRKIFPDTTLNTKNVRTTAKGNYVRNSDMFEIVNRKGVYRSAGVGGGITGMGCDYGIIDDPVKDAQDAGSPTVRQKVWDWYVSTFLTRVEEGGGVLIVMTRWHEDDLVGRILKQKNHGFKVINMPAISEQGNALWPEKYSVEFLQERKKTLGDRTFQSLYQGNPTQATGNLFKASWMKNRYDTSLGFARGDQMFQFWDTTFKEDGTSYVVGQCWQKKAGTFYLRDQVRGKWGFTKTVAQIEAFYLKWPNAYKCYIENKANGEAILDYFKSKPANPVPGVLLYDPGKRSKEERADAVTQYWEVGNVKLPENASWIDDFISEHLSFPLAANDDQVDVSSAALEIMNKQKRSAFSVGESRKLK